MEQQTVTSLSQLVRCCRGSARYEQELAAPPFMVLVWASRIRALSRMQRRPRAPMNVCLIGRQSIVSDSAGDLRARGDEHVGRDLMTDDVLLLVQQKGDRTFEGRLCLHHGFCAR